MNGKRFTIARRYGDTPVVKDEAGNISTFTPSDVLPHIEIYGQNEIHDISQNNASQRDLLARFLDLEHNVHHLDIERIIDLLKKNSKQINEVSRKMAEIQDDVALLSKLGERLGHFKSLGLEEKLKILPLLEEEKRLLKTMLEDNAPSLNKGI
ncbi:hypothetical protein [Alicyclobacillus mengziensis]|uniref:Uncharacterized protein n=1 Tax=Alicyclobacillus mengziensis TaxID=2931921 RepID=A0A9X7W067_9BACL|nr:hypothetical protein [Alicyclobacillus mengziensis]QSO46943.1 hypothetical protein JZ786_21355 [Alicyclobacillus mengziensis]